MWLWIFCLKGITANGHSMFAFSEESFRDSLGRAGRTWCKRELKHRKEATMQQTMCT